MRRGHQIMTVKREGLPEILLGGIVFLVALSFLIYSVFTTGLKESFSGNKFILYANFQSVEGIQLGSDVVLAGVKVGTVSDIKLIEDSFQAKLTFLLLEDYKLPDDTEAVVNSQGLLGGKYISLNVGGSDEVLLNGDELIYTQGSTSILNLINKFMGK